MAESIVTSVLEDAIGEQGLTTDNQVEKLSTQLKELEEKYHILESIIDEDENLWKALSEDRAEYDLPRDKQYEQMRRAWSAYCTNPIANRQVDHITNFVCGEDLKITSQVSEIEDWINNFWNDSYNRMGLRIREFSNGFAINGNIFLRFWISTETGKVSIREVPPFEIEEIIHDPEDISTTIYFKRKFTKRTWNETMFKDEIIEEFVPSIDTIANPELLKKVNVPSKEVNLGIGDTMESYIFHHKPPTISGRKWGMPSMASHLFWLREYKTLLRHITNLNKARSAYVMDVTVTGGPQDVVNEKKKHRIPPAPGSVLVHSDKVIYEFKNPSTGSANTAADLRSIKLMSVAGSGMPEHIVTGDASNANYASTKSTNYPFVRLMQAYQEYWKHAYLYGILYVVLWAGVEYGLLRRKYTIKVWDKWTRQEVQKEKKPIECVDIQFPQLDREELDRLAAAIRVYNEVGIVSKQSMCTTVGFDWNKEKPLIDAEMAEQQQLAQQQMQQQADIETQQQANAMLPQLQAAQAEGEQNIYLSKLAKDAGIPEAGPAGMAAINALSGSAAGMPMGPGQQPLMQSIRYNFSGNGTKLQENKILPTRALTEAVMKKLKKNKNDLPTRIPQRQVKFITKEE